MPNSVQTMIIIIAVLVAVIYLSRRMVSTLKGKDSFDCPFADQCDGCNCRKPELKDKCEISQTCQPHESG